jgi:hypothetical protein
MRAQPRGCKRWIAVRRAEALIGRASMSDPAETAKTGLHKCLPGSSRSPTAVSYRDYRNSVLTQGVSVPVKLVTIDKISTSSSPGIGFSGITAFGPERFNDFVV